MLLSVNMASRLTSYLTDRGGRPQKTQGAILDSGVPRL